MQKSRLLSHLLITTLVTSLLVPYSALSQEASHEPASQPTTPATVLDHNTLNALSDLVVNPHETLAIDFGNLASGINLSGNLTNNGSIYAYSTNPNVAVGSFNANNIFNNAGGLITSVLPNGGIPGLSLDLSSLVSNFSLNFNAVNNIVNAGTIASAGNLSMTAGSTITNAAAQANLAAMLSAVNSVSLAASNIVNSGIITAMQGNINLASRLSSDLIVNNLSGQLSALNGMINVRDAIFAGNYNTILGGGNWLSKELNIFSGDGIVDVNVNDILGTVNINAGCAHVQAATNNLLLGSLIITGDPTYYNTLGSITLTGPVSTTSGQNLAFAARQDITVSGNISTIASSPTNGTLIFIAGANITGPTPLADTQINNNTANTVTIASGGGSTTGGAINLTGAGNTITTSGGNLIMVAFSGSGAGSALTPGSISVAQSISTGSSGSSSNGSVTIIAGATSGAGVTTSSINTSGGSGSAGGAITIRTAAPITSGGTSLTNGALSGGFTAGTTTAASVSTGALTANGATTGSGRAGGAITISAGTAITTGAISTIGGTGSNNASADGGAAGGAGSVNLTAGSNISTGNISAYGGNGGNFTGTSGSSYFGGAGGTGGTVSLVTTGGGATVSSGFVNTSGGATGIGGYNAGIISASSAGAPTGGSAGSVTITAPGGISSGYIRAFGAGGSGGNNGSSGSKGTQGGNGGAGNNISLTATAGGITLTGDINTSGGGGGGTGNSGGTATGGAGGAGGNISISAAQAVQISGPVLAAAGGGGNGSSTTCCGGGGGASFGGGGGGADGGSAGGGIFGGGGTSNWGSASGGSAVAGGTLKNPQGSAGVTNGSAGLGGNSFDTTPNASRAGGVFGVGGVGTNTTANQVGQTGNGNMGGAAGTTNGAITISGASVDLTGTVASFYPGSTGGSTGFTTSPYADVSIYGGTSSQAVQVTATNGSVAIAGSLNVSGTDRSAQTTGVAGGNAYGLNITATGSINVGSITAAGGAGATNGGAGGAGGNVSLNAGQNINVNGTINVSGGNGAGSTSSSINGGNGGLAGTLSLIADGTLSVSGTTTANGGNGGGVTGSNRTGGAGGAGNNITLIASNAITLSAVSASGGNGGSKTGGANGSGGNGGNGASMLIVSTDNSVSTGSLTATGGVGGNGTGGLGVGGNGGAGGQLDVESQKDSITISGNANTSGGNGGSASTNGTVGQPTGNSGHSIQLMAIGTVSVSGYVAAAAGTSASNAITATNADIVLFGKTVNLPATGSALFGGTGGYNAFGGSSMTIVAPGSATLTQYSTNLDLTSTSTLPMAAFTGGTFTVGTTPPPGGNGATGRLGTKTASTLSINGIAADNPVSGSSSPNSFSGNLVVIYNGDSFLTIAPSQDVTAAQWVAAVQVANTSSQLVTLSPTGAGTQVSGTFTLADSNYPLITAGGGTSNNFTNINIPAGVTQNVTTTNTVTSTGNVIVNGSLNFQAGSSGTLATSGNNLTITANGTIQSTSGNLTIDAAGSGSSLAVGATGIVSATGGNVLITTPSVNNSGLITTSQNNGSVTIQNASALTLSGNGIISATGTGVNSLVIQTTTNADPIDFTGSWSFDPGAAGQVTISATANNSPITLGASTTQTINQGTLTISTRSLVFGNGASIVSSNTSGTAITIDNGGAGATLFVQGASGGSATIETSGADILVTTVNSRPITFEQSSTGGTTLNFNTQGIGTLQIMSSTNQTIDADVTVASDSSIDVATGGSNTVTINGSLTSSKSSGTIDIHAAQDLTIAGDGQITFSGGASGDITLTANGANTLAFTGNQTIDAGALGSVSLLAQSAGAIVQIAAGATQTVASGAAIYISTPNFRLLGDGAILNATSASDITIDSGAVGNNLVVRTQAGSLTAALSTAGGSIIFAPLTGGTLVFSKTNGDAAVLNLVTGGTGLVQTVTDANTNVNAAVTLSTDSNFEMNVNGGNTAIISGTITTSKADASLLIQSTTSLTLSGAGTLEVTGGGFQYITVQAQGANTLSVTGSLTYNADANAFVQLQSVASGGSVSFNNNTTQTINGSAYGQVIAPDITFIGNATFNNSDGYFDLTGDQLTTSITIGNNRTVTLNMDSGMAFIGSYAAQPLLITKVSGGSDSTLQVNGELQTYSNGADTTIDARVILSSNSNITVNTDGGALNVNGSITSSAVDGNITLSSRNGSLTMGGTPTGSISVTGGGASSILVQVSGASTGLTINSDYTFNAGATGAVVLIADQLALGANTTTTVSGSSTFSYYGQSVTFGAGAAISADNSVGLYASGGNNTLTITTPDNAFGTINVSSGQINIQGTSLVFAKSAGANSSTLNLNNANVYIQSVGGDTSIQSNLAVQSNRNITLEVNGNHNFALEGTLRSTNNAGVINISGTVGLTLSGSTAGTVQITGSGANSISLVGYDSGLTVNNSITLDAGPTGSAFIGASCCAMTMAANTSITFANETSGSVQATTLLLSGNNTITGSKSTGDALTIYSPNPNPFTWNLQANTASTVATGGGAINIYSPKNITIGINGGTLSSTATLNFTGGPVTMTANEGTTVISSRVTINSQKDITFNVNQATIGANGQINTSLGSITLIAATGTINIGNNVTMYANEGNLTIQNTNADGGSIDIASGASLTGYTVGNPALGFVNIVIGPIPSLPTVGDVPANVTVNESGGGIVYFGENSINASAPNNTINAKGRDVVFSTGDQGPEAITLGGNVTITADPPLPSDTTSQTTSTALPVVGLLSTSSISPDSYSTTIQSTVIPFDTISASTLSFLVGNDTINNSVTASLNAALPSESSDDLYSSLDPVKNPYQPISYSPGIEHRSHLTPDAGGYDIYTLETAGTIVKCIGNARVSVNQPGVVELKHGDVVIASTKGKTIVNSGDTSIAIEPSTIAYLSQEGTSLKIRNLHENGGSPLSVLVGGRLFHIGVGHEIVISESESAYQHKIQDNVARRHIRRVNQANKHIATCEFSLLSLIETSRILKQICHSKEADDKALEARLVKTAACLMLTTGSHGPYNRNPLKAD